jgi:hypothetical protein
MTTRPNFHTSAAMLIVTAAEKSGLLQEIAQALRYADKTHYDMPDGTVAREFCFACALREELIDAFDEHICLASIVLESFHGEGFVPHEASEEEIAPYLGISSSTSTPRST